MDVWLNYHHLYYFKTIASEGSIAKAAIKLRLGQPTLSMQLKQLEEKLGVPLFERKNKRLHLTEFGHFALEYSNEIFRLGMEMLEVIRDQKNPSRIHVQFGALDCIPKRVVTKLLKTAHSLKKCSVSLYEGKSEELMDGLMDHKLDLILTDHIPVLHGKKCFARKIGEYRVVACASPKFKALKNNFPQSLNGAPIILPSSHSRLRSYIDQYFILNSISPDLVTETQDTALQKLLGMESMGVILVAYDAVKSLIAKKELILLGELENVKEEIFIVSATRKIENPIAGAVFKNFNLK